MSQHVIPLPPTGGAVDPELENRIEAVETSLGVATIPAIPGDRAVTTGNIVVDVDALAPENLQFSLSIDYVDFEVSPRPDSTNGEFFELLTSTARTIPGGESFTMSVTPEGYVTISNGSTFVLGGDILASYGLVSGTYEDGTVPEVPGTGLAGAVSDIASDLNEAIGNIGIPYIPRERALFSNELPGLISSIDLTTDNAVFDFTHNSIVHHIDLSTYDFGPDRTAVSLSQIESEISGQMSFESIPEIGPGIEYYDGILYAYAANTGPYSIEISNVSGAAAAALGFADNFAEGLADQDAVPGTGLKGAEERLAVVEQSTEDARFDLNYHNDQIEAIKALGGQSLALMMGEALPFSFTDPISAMGMNNGQMIYFSVTDSMGMGQYFDYEITDNTMPITSFLGDVNFGLESIGIGIGYNGEAFSLSALMTGLTIHAPTGSGSAGLMLGDASVAGQRFVGTGETVGISNGAELESLQTIIARLTTRIDELEAAVTAP